jgi:hypothetical protein
MEVHGAFAQVLAEADNDERRVTTRPPPGWRARVLMAVSILYVGEKKPAFSSLKQPHDFRFRQRIEVQIEADDRR